MVAIDSAVVYGGAAMPRRGEDGGAARRGNAATRGSKRVSATAGKAGQRERLIQSMIELCAREGYPNVTVAQVSSRARVSATTFYEQFTDREDCLLAAYGAAVTRLLQAMPAPTQEGSWKTALERTLTVVLQAIAPTPRGRS